MVYLIVLALLLVVAVLIAFLCLWVVCRKSSESLFHLLGQNRGDRDKRRGANKRDKDLGARDRRVILGSESHRDAIAWQPRGRLG